MPTIKTVKNFNKIKLKKLIGHIIYQTPIFINIFIFDRMLEKDPEQRFDINQVDEAIKRIDYKRSLKSENIFEGILILISSQNRYNLL